MTSTVVALSTRIDIKLLTINGYKPMVCVLITTGTKQVQTSEIPSLCSTSDPLEVDHREKHDPDGHHKLHTALPSAPFHGQGRSVLQ